MSLLNIDISKKRKLSLKINQESINPKREEVILLQKSSINMPPTDEDINYTKLVNINPFLELLVDRLELVSAKTGEKLKKLSAGDI